MTYEQEAELLGAFDPVAILRPDQVASLRILEKAVRVLEPDVAESNTTEGLIATAFAYAMAFVLVPPEDAEDPALAALVAERTENALDVIRAYRQQ